LTKEELESHSIPEQGTLHKIRYEVNLLPNVGTHFISIRDPWTNKIEKKMRNKDTYFLTKCAECDEIEIFNAG
jgi:hypothetical protein